MKETNDNNHNNNGNNIENSDENAHNVSTYLLCISTSISEVTNGRVSS